MLGQPRAKQKWKSYSEPELEDSPGLNGVNSLKLDLKIQSQ